MHNPHGSAGQLQHEADQQEKDLLLESWPRLSIRICHLAAAALVPLFACYAVLLVKCGSTIGCAQYVHSKSAPTSLALAQIFWNCAGIYHLYVLACLSASHMRLARIAWVLTTAMLPFAVYAMTPAANTLALVMIVCAVTALRSKDCVLMVSGDPWPPQFQMEPIAIRLDLVLFLCFLLSSMYNYRYFFWGTLFNAVPRVSSVSAELFYGMWFDVQVPDYIPPFDRGFPNVVFIICWSVLPVLYTTYFVAAYLKSTGQARWLQHFACFLGIFHFSLTTDFVCYRFGRGIAVSNDALNAVSHWLERAVFRVSVLLSFYHMLYDERMKRTRPSCLSGTIMHYIMLGYACAFLVIQCGYDLITVTESVIDRSDHGGHPPFGVKIYLCTLVLLFIYYFLALVLSKGDYIVLGQDAESDDSLPESDDSSLP